MITSKSEEAVKLALQIIRERVDTFGVSESVVQRQGLTGSRIIVQLPGVEDTDRVKRLIEGTAKLELKLVLAGPAPTREALLAASNGQVPPGAEVLPHTGVREDGSSFTEYLLVSRSAIISGDELQSASRTVDEYGRPAVNFNIQSGSAEKFGRFTEANIGIRVLQLFLMPKFNRIPQFRRASATPESSPDNLQLKKQMILVSCFSQEHFLQVCASLNNVWSDLHWDWIPFVKASQHA